MAAIMAGGQPDSGTLASRAPVELCVARLAAADEGHPGRLPHEPDRDVPACPDRGGYEMSHRVSLSHILHRPSVGKVEPGWMAPGARRPGRDEIGRTEAFAATDRGRRSRRLDRLALLRPRLLRAGRARA